MTVTFDTLHRTSIPAWANIAVYTHDKHLLVALNVNPEERPVVYVDYTIDGKCWLCLKSVVSDCDDYWRINVPSYAKYMRVRTRDTVYFTNEE